jgi:hypothetical protein
MARSVKCWKCGHAVFDHLQPVASRRGLKRYACLDWKVCAWRADRKMAARQITLDHWLAARGLTCRT